jgi:hypothetical protein
LKDQTAPLTSQTETKTEPSTKTEPETKTEPKAGETKTEPAKTEPGKAPDKYADFKVPEGFTLNKDALEAAVPVFKELGLTQEQAQKLVDIQAKRESELAKSGQGDYAAVRKGWRDEVLADTTLSAGGKVKPEVLQTIGRAIDGINNPKLAADFRQVMDTTGVGDNPAFVRAFFAMAQQLTEGRPTTGKGPSPEGQKAPDAKPTSIANAMYPNLK